ncbi:hypothetical protein ULMS_02440 [Patiriisocius marinistellae]|uniref:histidine kinase n=1 Tax=Patiriisocius marinistellae TaxID=2494560 RepID=A0A5J4FX80_9FLAO|nr:sensor histidine kinase [Patiriisocius marinistellae]GEQ84736.1 hypothetical protein ULMS_02440 [Patiriisocius marinistellae]
MGIPPVNAQDEISIEERIEKLMQLVENSEGIEKLQWLDSLSNIIAYDTNFMNDSIVLTTIKFAKKLDSFNTATWHIANEIYHLNSRKGTPEKSKELFLKSMKHRAKVNDPNVLCKYFYEGGNTHYFLGEFETALQLFDSTFIQAKRANNNRFIGLAKLGKGQVYTDSGDFGNASLTLQDAIKFFTIKQDSTSIIEAKNSLSILYSKNGFYDEAETERNEIIKFEVAGGHFNTLPAVYYNAAADYNKQDRQMDRIVSLKLSLEAARKSDHINFYEPIMLTGLIAAYAENDSLQEAKFYLKKIYKNKEQNTSGQFRDYYLGAIKNMAFAEMEYSKAIEYGTEYLKSKRQGKQYEEIQAAEKFLAKVYQTIGEKGKAFDHYIEYSKIKDSIENAKKVRVLSYYQTIYETEKLDLKIKAQQKDIAFINEMNKVRMQWFFLVILLLIGIFGVFWLARSRNYARNKQKLQEEFTKDVLKTQEKERARIAGELHDSVGQKLLILKNSLVQKDNGDKKEIDLVGDTIKEVREMSHGLHPFQFEKLGLVQSLKNMVETFQKNSNIFYSEDIEIEYLKFPKEKEIYVFRMLQEAITNVEKHSDATACNLTATESNNQIIFILKDNGKGFDLNKNTTEWKGLGMKTLEERARFIDANLQIDSLPHKGTTITLKIPIK